MIFDAPHFSRVLKRLTYLVLSVIGIYLAFKLAIFYMPFLVAFIISLIMEPAIKFLMNKFKLTRRTSSIIMFIIVFGAIFGSLIWGIATIISEATGLLEMLNGYFDKIYLQVQNFITNFNFDKFHISQELMVVLQNSTEDILNSISDWLKVFLTNLVNFVTSIPIIAIYFVVTILALYFICTDKIYILDQAEHHLPKKWSRKMAIHIKEISSTLGGYLKAQATLILVSFIISLVGLYIYKLVGLDVGYPLLMALAVGFVDALPILGLWILMSLVRQFLEPRIVSKNIGIHPIFTLIAMYTGFKLIGIIGLIIGPIILIILKNIFANLIDKGIVKTIFDRV